jgi:Flp pilus assembly protein TadB
MQSSLSAAANAMQESPIQTRLAPVLAAIELGADPRDAWSTLMDEPVLGQLAMSVMRSYDTGSGLEPVLVGIASEMRREHRSRVEVAARTAGVKAVIPLAVCFLPAFFALGVVPIVASLAASTGLIPD